MKCLDCGNEVHYEWPKDPKKRAAMQLVYEGVICQVVRRRFIPGRASGRWLRNWMPNPLSSSSTCRRCFVDLASRSHAHATTTSNLCRRHLPSVCPRQGGVPSCHLHRDPCRSRRYAILAGRRTAGGRALAFLIDSADPSIEYGSLHFVNLPEPNSLRRASRFAAYANQWAGSTTMD